VPLKQYQERVLREVKHFLDLLAAEQAAGNRHATLDAWREAKKTLPGLVGTYRERENGLGKDLPTFCVKVPTGGGKTLLATQILGLIHQTILKGRNGAGLVLWVVPSDQIYKDTLKALRDRRHFYRESLEHALSRRLEIWEKQDVARLTPAQVQNNLNILLLKLPSTNRQDRESLKFFRDSGGNVVLHFPPEDEPERHRELKQRYPNMDMLADDPVSGACLVATSLANLVRTCEPAVILDEGHKATSAQARKTIETFNPNVVVELSATPHDGANVLVRVSGQELLAEQMIKLPINVANSNQTAWKDVLTQARDKRKQLADLAEQHYKATGRRIRPIVLVQVERTGKDQRETNYIHSEDVREHLIEGLNVAKEAIAVKSSEKDDIEGIDLLDESCPVEWIITKSALQEGWDCPFAYVLVSLNNTASEQSMTQLVGRVLRQPDVTRTAFDGLNESYVYCLRKTAGDILKEVKKALEKEGYEGEAASVVDRSGGAAGGPAKRTTGIKPEFSRHYRTPFEGKVYLPRFCVKNGRKTPEPLDYYRHLVSQVEVSEFDYAAVTWNLSAELNEASEQFYRIGLGQEAVGRMSERAASGLETEEQVRAWLVANLRFDQFSHKQLRAVVHSVTDRLCEVNPELRGRLALVKFVVREKTAGFIERETDRLTKEIFEGLFLTKKLTFHLECVECRFEVPPSVEVRATRPLSHDNGDLTKKSLYDYMPDDLNDYEKSVALFLDKHPQVLWWYRNLVGRHNFSIQGYRRDPIYPDFVLQEGREQVPVPLVFVLESKGKHLKGNMDTNYKRSVADYFEKTGHKVRWQQLGEEFADHTFRFQILDEGDYADRDWKEELRRMLGNAG
jgi:type III restriction enzyme